jgi:hypothetical protein
VVSSQTLRMQMVHLEARAEEQMLFPFGGITVVLATGPHPQSGSAAEAQAGDHPRGDLQRGACPDAAAQAAKAHSLLQHAAAAAALCADVHRGCQVGSCMRRRKLSKFKGQKDMAGLDTLHLQEPSNGDIPF